MTTSIHVDIHLRTETHIEALCSPLSDGSLNRRVHAANLTIFGEPTDLQRLAAALYVAAEATLPEMTTEDILRSAG